MYMFRQACIVTLCGGAAPRGAPVRVRLSCGAAAVSFSSRCPVSRRPIFLVPAPAATPAATRTAPATSASPIVLALMAEGRSNATIAATLVVTERAVDKHIGNIFAKLGLPPSDADHRRVLAVLRYLGSRQHAPFAMPSPSWVCALASN